MRSLPRDLLAALRAAVTMEDIAVVLIPALIKQAALGDGFSGRWLRGSVHVFGELGHQDFALVELCTKAQSRGKELLSTTAWALMGESPGFVHVDAVRGRAVSGQRERLIRAGGTQSALLARDTTDMLAFPVLDRRGRSGGMVSLELELPSRERAGLQSKLLAAGPAMAELVEACSPWVLAACAGEAEKIAREIAGFDRVTVLLLGETGTGKTRLARLIHQWSPRAQQPLYDVNLSSTPPELIAATLFGTVPGAFTNAVRQRGMLEEAHRGTLFLDEVGKLDLRAQAILIDVLERRGFRPLGDSTSKPVNPDVRFVLATNENLPKLVAEGRFMDDLYRRMNVFPIELPPLRRQIEKIPGLAHRFLSEHSDQWDGVPLALSPDALELLQAQHWPGNIRQLESTLVRAAVRSRLAGQTQVDAECIGWALALDRPPSPPQLVSRRLRDAAREYALEVLRQKDSLRRLGLDQLSAMRGLVLLELEAIFRAEGLDEVRARRRAFEALGEDDVVKHANDGREWRKEQARVATLMELLLHPSSLDGD